MTDITTIQLICILTLSGFLAYLLFVCFKSSKTFKKLEQKRISNNIALDECNRKLDICIENLKKATKYYEGLKDDI